MLGSVLQLNKKCWNSPGLNYSNEDFKLEKGPTDKAKEPDTGGSNHQNFQSNRTVSFSIFQFFVS